MADLYELWKKGVSLDSLVIHWMGKGKEEVPSAGEGHPCSDYYAGMDDWDYLTEIRKNLTQNIWSAIGYSSPRSIKSTPLIVPGDFFLNCEIGISESQVWGDGLNFVGIRLIHSSLLNGEIEKSENKPGRPSREHEIDEAFKALGSENKLDLGKPLATHIEAVRNRVLKNSGIENSRGLGEKVMYRVLSPLYSELRSSAKK